MIKKNLLFIGILFLGFSIIISAIVISKSFGELTNLNSILNGSLTVSNADSNYNESDILQAFDAGIILGYDSNNLIRDIENGNLEGIPFTKLGGHYLFSKKALEEWIYNKTIK